MVELNYENSKLLQDKNPNIHYYLLNLKVRRWDDLWTFPVPCDLGRGFPGNAHSEADAVAFTHFLGGQTVSERGRDEWCYK